MPEPVRYDVLGVHVSAIDRAGAVALIGDWIARRERKYVCATGVHGVMESQRDPALREIHNRSGLTAPDGMPLVWCARYARMTQTGHVRGPDLMLDVLAAAEKKGWTSYFYGGREGVPELLVNRLRETMPNLAVVGTHSPPFRPLTEAEDEAIVAEINSLAPDLVWVGLSTPKQERWMAEHRDRLDAPVLLGVGAAFDMHAGLVKRAPSWLHNTGLEWVYRLIQEPRRLWRRYFRNNPAFVAGVLRHPPRPLPPPWPEAGA
ncbi:MAG: WecB/TagA/CpsF family glycosyltransferase [Frankia sp.]|nr:WecB/TagA/CpsF family glycosyltransferase [Frankia sp.]